MLGRERPLSAVGAAGLHRPELRLLSAAGLWATAVAVLAKPTVTSVAFRSELEGSGPPEAESVADIFHCLVHRMRQSQSQTETD